MGRADPNRDYYADLELPPTADVADVKRQFRKLALKYHPDRNPGRETEVNAKFQTIQSAHEILIDPEQKAKYDASRARSGRFASGVKGNPWKDVGHQFPTPPKRTTSTRPPAPSGASRYQGFAPAPNHPTAKARSKEDPAKASRDNYNAWEKMRAASHTQSSQPQKPTTARPGSREAKTTAPEPPPRTPSQKQRQEAAFGNRRNQSRPSVHDEEQQPQAENYPTTPASTLFQKAATKAATNARMRRETAGLDPRNILDGRQSTPYHSSSGEKTNPFDGVSINRTPSTRERHHRGDGNSNQQQQRSSSVPRSASKDEVANGLRVPPSEPRPSTAGEVPNSERRNSARASASYAKSKAAPSQHVSSENQHAPPMASHGIDEPPIFTFSANRDTSTSSRGPADLSGAGSEGMPTRQVEDDGTNPFHFSAGGHPLDPDPRRRSKSTGADRSQSPVRRSRAMRDNGVPREQAGSDQFEGGFDPKDWGEKLGSYNVFSQPSRTGGTSPTRPARANSKKPKNIRPTMGTAGMVNSESEEDIHARFHAEPDSAHSPNAMDIDTPPPERTDDAEKSAGARSIPVEPSKPEWRPGDLSGLGNGQSEARGKPGRVAADVTGSEDSEEFMASFADLKNVAPFKTQPSGLRSFTEMKDSLPFESQASAHITIENERVMQNLNVSSPPPVPQLPIPVNEETKQMLLDIWPNHAQQFQKYLLLWEDFNRVVLGRFGARQSANAVMYRRKGSEIMSEQSLEEQLHCLKQDNELRRMWNLANDEHEQALREFLSAKKKMESI